MEENEFAGYERAMAEGDAKADWARPLQKKISLVGDMHLEFERQFADFTNIIPYKYNWEVRERIYSPRLYSLLQGINSYVDAMCKILTEIFSIRVDGTNPPASRHFEKLNEKGMLTIQKVSLVELPLEIIEPFVVSDKVPSWWTANNKAKHDLPEGSSQATYGNVINALGGLVCLLHISSKPFIHENIANILEAKGWIDDSLEFVQDYRSWEFNEYATAALKRGRNEYLDSQQKKYRSFNFYYHMEYPPLGMKEYRIG